MQGLFARWWGVKGKETCRVKHTEKTSTSRLGGRRGGNSQLEPRVAMGKEILQAAVTKGRGSSTKLHLHGERKSPEIEGTNTYLCFWPKKGKGFGCQSLFVSLRDTTGQRKWRIDLGEARRAFPCHFRESKEHDTFLAEEAGTARAGFYAYQPHQPAESDVGNGGEPCQEAFDF